MDCAQCFLSEKNICEHAIVCVKIVAECKEYVLMETVAIQDTQDRVFLFIRYLYPDETRPETRKRRKKWADLWEAKVGEPSGEDFFDLGFAATGKTYSFSWPVYSSLSLVESLSFSWYCMWQEFWISWKPSDYSKRKRSTLHHMKSHGKLNASGFVFTRNRHVFKRIVNEICVLQRSY